MIAALYVQTGGAYFGLPGVDPWDATRDARLYAGPDPVVAHPPCARWCRLAGLVESLYPHLRKGEDDGCFAAALASVRRHGGVLEHPAYSLAWAAYDLPRPNRHGGWQRGTCGGWSCQVDQRWYGHRARKPTWLYAFGTVLPDLRWGPSPGTPEAVVSFLTRRGDGTFWRGPKDVERLSPRARSATPPAFKKELLTLAQSAHEQRRAA